AKAVITPDVKASKVYMAGFGNNRVATGVHDDLYVRCLALAAGNDNLVMCASDLIGLFYDDVLKVREQVKSAAPGVTAVIGASTDQPISTLVNWSDHPETPGERNTLITADYPHWLCDSVEKRVGGMAVFFNGSIGGLLSTLGDQVALEDPESGETARNNTWKKAEL